MANLGDSLFNLISKVQISYKLTPPIMVSDSGFRIEDPVKHSVEQLITKLVMG